MPSPAGCLAPRHDEPEPAEPGARLCRPCLSGLTRDLRRLPALYAGLAELLDPRVTGDGGGAGDGLPFNDSASECMSQVRHDLQVWARRVVTERQPAAWPVLSVPAMCGWLAGWVDWASRRPWAGDMAGAVASDRGRAVALLDPRPAVRITVPAALNRCPRCEVAGGMAAVVYTGPGDPRPSLVTCGGCGHEWDATQWLKLGRDILRNSERTAA
jgi:hypothetical protein